MTKMTIYIDETSGIAVRATERIDAPGSEYEHKVTNMIADYIMTITPPSGKSSTVTKKQPIESTN